MDGAYCGFRARNEAAKTSTSLARELFLFEMMETGSHTQLISAVAFFSSRSTFMHNDTEDYDCVQVLIWTNVFLYFSKQNRH